MSKAFYSTMNFIILSVILGVAFYIVNQKYIEISQPCALPLGYAIGDVDERFGLSIPEVLRAANQAEEIWESATNSNIYQYAPDADLKVHLRFDNRQAETLKIKEIEGELSQKDEVYNKLKREAQELKISFEEEASQYERQEQSYRTALEVYNRQVQEINRDGGASQKQVEYLAQQRESLEQQANNLETRRQGVNDIVEKQQEKVNELNALARVLNGEVENFNQTYGGEKVFDQGQFTGREIVIYQYTEFRDLVLVIAHELGHARGLGHVSDPNAIMHEIFHGDSDKQNTVTQEDRQELERACNPDVSLF